MSEFETLRLLLDRLLQDALLLLPRLLVAALILLLARLVGGRARKLVLLALRRPSFSVVHRRFFAQLASWAVYFFGISLALTVMGWQGLAAGLLAGSSVTAIIIGFAFREIGENFLAGFFLAFSRPFRVGDLIESSGFQGVVREIDLRTTHIRTGDGRDVFIPNARIFNQPLVNYTRDGTRRLSFEVGIDYSDDSKLARALLLRAVQEVDGILADPPAGVTIKELAADYVVLNIFFWIDVFDKNLNLGIIQTVVMNRCREVLLSSGFTVSANVSANVSLEAAQSLRVALEAETRP